MARRFFGQWLKPVPRDDTTSTFGTEVEETGIRPTIDISYPNVGGSALLAGYYPSYATLDGPHWRVGTMFYPGVSQPSVNEAQGTRDISMTPIRPPQVPNVGGRVTSVRDAYAFAKLSLSNYPGMPMFVPEGVRR